MIEFKIDSELISLKNEDELSRFIKEHIASRVDTFVIQKAPGLTMDVISTGRFIAVGYNNYTSGCIMKNASSTPSESADKVVIKIGHTPTPIPKNMFLSKSLGIEVIKEFCIKGTMYDRVYWIPGS